MISPPLSVEKAGKLAPSIRLREVSFVELHAKYVSTDKPPTGSCLSWDLADPSVVWSLEGNDAIAVVPMKLSVGLAPDVGSESVPFAEISVLLRIEYEIAEGIAASEDELSHYMGISGFMHAWPYLRAEVQALTMKLGLPPLVLPVIVSGYPAKKVSVIASSEIEGAKSKRRIQTAKPKQLPKRKAKQ